MKILCIALATCCSLFADNSEKNQVVIQRYKLAALTGLETKAIAAYQKELDPGRKCVMLSLTSEFSGDFLFFARLISSTHLEILCFTPTSDSKPEWAGKIIKFEGASKEHYQKLHQLLEMEARLPKEEPKEVQPVHGESCLSLSVGDGPTIERSELRSGFIVQNPERKKRLLESIGLAESLAGLPLSRVLE